MQLVIYPTGKDEYTATARMIIGLATGAPRAFGTVQVAAEGSEDAIAAHKTLNDWIETFS
jgi:hypothetical protein